MPPRTDARARMVASAATLLPALGVRGTSFTRVIEHSGAPRGSIGHHFPGGKDEMIRAAVEVAGDRVTRRIRGMADEGASFDEVIAGLCDYFAVGLTKSDFRAGCPVAAVALDDDTPEGIRAAAISVIDGWIGLVAEIAESEGISHDEARLRAERAIHSIEGALILCRLRRSTTPLDSIDVGDARAGQP